MIQSREFIDLKERRKSWGWAPAISLTLAAGLLIIAASDVLARQGLGGGELLFWIGLAVLILPPALRLTASRASRRERIAVVVLAGLAFYAVKIMQSPYGFTYADEFIHAFNVTQIQNSGGLFQPNPILPVTPYYPGLEILTSALATMGGLSVFSAGLIVIGLARLILMLSLYLFYEQVGGSGRVAGMAALIYASNPNFLFWSSQFSYESLALPLGLMVLFVIARRDRENNHANYRALTILAVLGIAVVVITHHLSSYFLVIFLTIWAVLSVLIPLNALRWLGIRAVDRTKHISYLVAPFFYNGIKFKKTALSRIRGPRWLALLAILLAGAWLFLVARITINYLYPVLSRAVLSVVNIIAGLQSPRLLFTTPTSTTLPLWAQIVAILSVLVALAGVPLGLVKFWQRYRGRGISLLLVLMGLAYFGFLVLRLSPQAWETANRASEFLYLGLAFLLAIGAVELWRKSRFPWIGKTVFMLCVGILVFGGVIAGWPQGLDLQQPALAQVGPFIIAPEGQAVARWSLASLGPGNRMGADPSNARLLLLYGNQVAYSSSTPDIQDILRTPTFATWMLQELQKNSIGYLVVDRRLVSRDAMTGYFFDPSHAAAVSLNTGGLTSGFLNGSKLADPQVYGKFDQVAGVSRILDSGDIIIYDFIKAPALK
jgi:hypothetical protein